MSGEAKEAKEESPHYAEAHEDSSDDEADHKLPTHQFEKHFNFYDHLHLNFAPFHDILDSFKTLKSAYDHHKEESKLADSRIRALTKSHKTSSTGSSFRNNQNTNNNSKGFDIRTYQSTMFDPRTSKKNNHTIAKFRLDEPRWDGTAVPSDELQKELYRIPIADSSGTVIKSLARDLAKGKKWAPPESDRDLPEPTFANCSESRQRIVLKHMEDVIDKVEIEYSKMKADTQDKSSLKARIGADLNDLKRKRERLVREIAEKEAAMKAKAEAKRDKSPPRKKKEHKEAKEESDNNQTSAEVTTNLDTTDNVETRAAEQTVEENPSLESSQLSQS
jgi:hypothetical protein